MFRVWLLGVCGLSGVEKDIGDEGVIELKVKGEMDYILLKMK